MMTNYDKDVDSIMKYAEIGNGMEWVMMGGWWWFDNDVMLMAHDADIDENMMKEIWWDDGDKVKMLAESMTMKLWW